MRGALRLGLLAACLVGMGAARSASAATPALELGAPLSPSVARDVDALGRIAVEGPNALDGLPTGWILLPPHPGGGVVELPCSGFDPINCFHVGHVATAIARPGQPESAVHGLSAAGLAVGRSGPPASSLAVLWGAPTQVPSLSSVGLALLGVALAAIGTLVSAASGARPRVRRGSGAVGGPSGRC
jgi:hypothetical protein